MFFLTDISVVVSLKASELKKSCPLLKLGDVRKKKMKNLDFKVIFRLKLANYVKKKLVEI